LIEKSTSFFLVHQGLGEINQVLGIKKGARSKPPKKKDNQTQLQSVTEKKMAPAKLHNTQGKQISRETSQGKITAKNAKSINTHWQ